MWRIRCDRLASARAPEALAARTNERRSLFGEQAPHRLAYRGVDADPPCAGAYPTNCLKIAARFFGSRSSTVTPWRV